MVAFLVLMSFFMLAPAQARDLSELELFYRCYAQIARSRPAPDSPLLAQVAKGQKSAVSACMEVLGKADLTAAGKTEIASRSDTEGAKVLETFQALHSTWFSQRRFASSGDACVNDASRQVLDPSTAALYITRAMFRTDLPYSSIVKGTDGVQAVRETQSPSTGLAGKAYPFQFELGTSPATYSAWMPPYVPRGQLFGVKTATQFLAPPLVLSSSPLTVTDVGMDLNKSFGGGFLGTQSYLIANVNQEPDIRSPQNWTPNGAEVLARKWAKWVYKDVLCRDLPVVRISDGKPYVDTNSSVSFRQSASCTQCHSSMDRTAMGIRNLTYASTYRGCNQYANPKYGFYVFHKTNATLPSETVWPTTPDKDFWKRPEKGTLYYRSYDGHLVHKSFVGLEGLGAALADENDMYVCTAKRYLRYFTGVEANLQDITDPLNPVQLSEKELYYRNVAIRLGKNLRSHQDLQKLVKEIISSDLYRSKDFGLAGE